MIRAAFLIMYGIFALIAAPFAFRALLQSVREPARRNHAAGKAFSFLSFFLLMAFAALDPLVRVPDYLLAIWSVLFWVSAGFGILFSLTGDHAETEAAPASELSQTRSIFQTQAPQTFSEAETTHHSPVAALVISLIAIVASPFIVGQNISFRLPAFAAPPVSSEVSRLPGKDYVFEDYNLKFTAPQAPWIEMNMKQWNPDTLAGFVRANPNIYLQLIAEKNVAFQKGEERVFAEQIYAILASKVQDHRLISTTPLSHAGIEGFLFFSEIRVDGHKVFRLHWMGGKGGFYYQVVLFSQSNLTEKEMKTSMDEVLKGFSLIDPSKEAKPDQVAEDYESKRYGYRLKAKDSGWSKWWLPNNDRVLNWADYKISRGNNAAMLVFPVFFFKPAPPMDILAPAMLRLNTIEMEKIPLETIKAAKENGYDMREINYQQKIENDLYHYSIKILENNNRAFFVTAYQSEKFMKQYDPEMLPKAVKMFETTAPGAAPKIADLKENEKQLHARVYTLIGDEYFRKHMTKEGLDYYEDAFKFIPEDLGLLKALVSNLIELEYYVDALDFLKKYGKNFPGDLDLLYSSAFCNFRLKNYAEARKNYEELFDKGKISKDSIREYLAVMKALKEETAGRQKALQLFKSDSPEQMIWLASIFNEQGDSGKKESIQLLADLYQKHPRNEDVRGAYLFALMADSQYDKVVKTAEEHLGKYGISEDVLTAQGFALAALKRYSEAKTAFVNAKGIASEQQSLEMLIKVLNAVQDQINGKKERISHLTVHSVSRFENEGDMVTEEHITLVNQWANAMRIYLWEKEEDDWKKDYSKYLSYYYPRLELQTFKVTHLDENEDAPLDLDLTYVSTRDWQKAGDKWIAALPLTWEARSLIFEEDQDRIFPFDLFPPGEVTSERVLEYPAASYKIVHSLPAEQPEKKLSCGTYSSKVTEEPGKLKITHYFQMNGGGYSVEESDNCRKEFIELFYDSTPKIILEPKES